MVKVTIETIPHKKQLYPTVGDWRYDSNGDVRILVSDMKDWRMEALVAIHELVEVVLCRHDKVPQSVVDAFDIEFEKARKEGNVDEPGDDPKAPYQRQHCFATAVERMVAAALGVKWKEYDKTVEEL